MLRKHIYTYSAKRCKMLCLAACVVSPLFLLLSTFVSLSSPIICLLLPRERRTSVHATEFEARKVIKKGSASGFSKETII